MIKQWKKMMVAVLFTLAVSVVALASPTENFDANSEEQTTNVESSFEHALEVQVKIIQSDGNTREFYRPAVIVGEKHLLMYLGELKKGEIIQGLIAEKQISIYDFKASYNNIWVSKENLYKNFERHHVSRFKHVVLLLSLEEAISNSPVNVFGMDMPETTAATDFLASISGGSTLRRTDRSGWIEEEVPLTIYRVEKVAAQGLPFYYATGTESYWREGAPLYASFTPHNGLGMPTTRLALVGFKLNGENIYRGFTHAHIRQGRKYAPEVEWLGH